MEEKESLLLFPFRRPFLASLGITCIYFFLGWLFFTPFFQTSDDMAMNWITRGIVLVDRPSEFLIVVNVLLGIILKNLNLILPHISWYGWGLYSFFFISVWALGAAFFSRERSPWAIYVFFAVGTPVFFHCYAWPQYTVYCFLAVQAGIFLLANPCRPRPIVLGLASFLIFGASLIRLEPSLFSIAASSFYLYQAFRQDRETGGSESGSPFFLSPPCSSCSA